MNVTRLHNENVSKCLTVAYTICRNRKTLNIEVESFFGYFLFPTQFECVIEVYGAGKKCNFQVCLPLFASFFYLLTYLLNWKFELFKYKKLSILMFKIFFYSL